MLRPEAAGASDKVVGVEQMRLEPALFIPRWWMSGADQLFDLDLFQGRVPPARIRFPARGQQRLGPRSLGADPQPRLAIDALAPSGVVEPRTLHQVELLEIVRVVRRNRIGMKNVS